MVSTLSSKVGLTFKIKEKEQLTHVEKFSFEIFTEKKEVDTKKEGVLNWGFPKTRRVGEGKGSK